MATFSRLRTTALVLAVLAIACSGAALTSSSAAAPGPGERTGTLITYHGTEAKATLPLRPNRLPGAPTDFRRFIKGQLHVLWDQLGHTPACKSSPIITVHAVRTDGFGMGSLLTRPRQHCPAAGGGYVAIWAVRHGAWKEVIGTQDVIACSRLERFGIPSEIGVHECYQDGEVVPYEHA